MDNCYSFYTNFKLTLSSTETFTLIVKVNPNWIRSVEIFQTLQVTISRMKLHLFIYKPDYLRVIHKLTFGNFQVRNRLNLATPLIKIYL